MNKSKQHWNCYNNCTVHSLPHLEECLLDVCEDLYEREIPGWIHEKWNCLYQSYKLHSCHQSASCTWEGSVEIIIITGITSKSLSFCFILSVKNKQSWQISLKKNILKVFFYIWKFKPVNWPKGYLRPYDVVLSNKKWEEEEGGDIWSYGVFLPKSLLSMMKPSFPDSG